VVVTILVAWTSSQLSPAWATRYFAVVLAPSIVLGAAGVARAGRVGAIALALVLVLWTNNTPRADKSDVREVSQLVAPYAHRGDVVLSTHPEQVPVLRYYLGPGYRWATTLGSTPDSQIMDWRDALDRIDAVRPKRELAPVLASVKPGRHLVVVTPVFRDYRAWRARWTRRVYLSSQLWSRTIAADPRFRRVATVQTDEILLKRNYFKPLQAVVYVRNGGGGA